MSTSFGECVCGKTLVAINLPDALEKYSPRQCDCDFCSARNISYLSHSDGTLEVKSSAPLQIEYQGSNQAMFMSCKTCNTVIVAAIRSKTSLIGALNSNLLFDAIRLQKATLVSPKLLSADEKIARWQNLWLKIKVSNTHA